MIKLDFDQLIERLRRSGINVIVDSDTHRLVASSMASNMAAEIDAEIVEKLLNLSCPDGYCNETEEVFYEGKSS